MRTHLKLILLPFLLIALSIQAQQPSWQNLTTIGGNGPMPAGSLYCYEGVRDMAVDKWGNTYVVGSVGINPEANGNLISPSNYGGDYDAYVAKFNRCGALEWMYVSGSNGTEDAFTGIAVDNEGNCYVNGFCESNTFRFVCNGLDTVYNLPCSGVCPSLGFWFKLNPQGQRGWIKPFDCSNGAFRSHYIAMSPNDNLYMLFLRNKMGNSADTLYGIATSHSGQMISKIDINTGNILRYSFLDSLYPFPYKSLTVDKDENIYSIIDNLTNNPADTIKYIDGTRLIMPMYGSNIIKLDSNFHLLKAVTSKMGVDGFYLLQLKLLRDRVVLNAGFNTGSSLGNLYFPVNRSRSAQNAIVSMTRNLDSIRVYFPDTAWTSHNSLLAGADPDNMYYLHTGVRILKWGAINRPTPPGGIVNDTTRIAKVTTSNFWIENVSKLQDFAAVAGTWYDYRVTTEDEQGNMYFAGEFSDRITIPSKSATPKGGSPSPDGFVLKWGLPCSDNVTSLIQPREPSKLIATTISQNRVDVVWQDNAQYEEGFRIFRSLNGVSGWVVIDSVGQDVTTYSDLSVSANNIYWYKVHAYNPNGASDFTNADSAAVGCVGVLPSSSLSDSACISYTSPSGNKTFTTSGMYQDTIIRVGQCDSVIYLNITIHQPGYTEVFDTACEQYIWLHNGQTYNTSGIFSDTVATVFGCDSVITLNLTIRFSNTDTQDVSSCSDYTWVVNGQTYTTSGFYSDTLTNANGCDSIITLNLNIGNETIINQSAQSCGSYIWSQTGQSYTASGIYTDTVFSASCDSIFVLDLTIGNANSATQNVSSCGSYTWSVNGQTYSSSGQHTATLTNVSGCDSVITLNLTINNVAVTTEPTDQTAALGTSAQFSLAAQGASLSYQWQRDQGTGFQNVTNGGQYSGATTNAQTVSNITLNNNNNAFRCIVSSGTCKDTSATAILKVYDPNSITEIENKEISIYPNPTSALLHVEFERSDMESLSLSIKDLVGREVYVKKVLTQKNSLNLAELSTGSYMVYITNADGKILHLRKVVVE
jgi:hypothetical protein